MSGRRRGIGLGGWMRRRRRRSPTADLVKLCESLHLDGWEHLTAEGGVVVVTPGDPTARQAPWHIVATAIAAWAGPLSLLDPGEPIDRELLASLRVGGPVDEAEALERLASGEKVLVLAEEGRVSEAEELAGSAELRSVLARVEAAAEGRQRLTVRPTS